MSIKYFIGPMSKNTVDAVLEFISTSGNRIGFIPSRRQVGMKEGYVNHWSTKTFRRYVSSHFIVRDHAGPSQGLQDDDGYESLKIDCKYLDMIHIDPWKRYPEYEEGLRWTVDMIKYCHQENPNIFFEVATEESIRRFTAAEINTLLSDLKRELNTSEYEKIKYCVIQSGTSLQGNENTGSYDKERLKRMLQIVHQHGLLAKEHNGDYLPRELIREKFSLGLDSINIAPEFGQIETKTYLHKIKNEKPELLEAFWQICYDSGRWEKWVDDYYDPIANKEDLINICGHYVLSHPDFIAQIHESFKNIDGDIRKNIKQKLEELFDG